MCCKTRCCLKKAIALSFLLLAKTIILAHFVISHHHHDGIHIALIAAHHKHDCNSHEHHCNDPYCHGNIEDCSLANLYVRFDNDNLVIRSFDCIFDLLSCFLTQFSGYNSPQIADDVGLPFRQNPFLKFFFTEFIACSTGLRAPPFELF